MKIVLLLGPSSTGKSTLCEELQSAHQWEVVSSDVVRDKMRLNVGEDLKKELNAEGLILPLSQYSLTEDEVVQFCQNGQLKISKDGHEVKYIVRNLSMPDIEEVLNKAGFADSEVTSLSGLLRAVGKVHGRYYSNERLDRILLDEVFSDKHDKDASIIIDTVPEGAEGLIANFNERADKYRKEHGEHSLDTSIVLAHITPQRLSERVQVRNEEAERSKNPRNKREGMFPFQQLGSVVTAKDASDPASSQTLGTVSNPELLKIAYRHNPYKPHEKKSFKRAGQAAVEYVRLSKKMGLPRDKTAKAELSVRGDFKFDAMIDMSEGNPKELASKLLTAIDRHPEISKISEKVSITVDDIPGDEKNKRVRFYCADSEKKHTDLMLVTFALPVGNIIETEMKYSEKDKGWICELSRPANAKETFFFAPNAKPTDPQEKKQANPPIPGGMIALSDGKQQPWVNEDPSVPKGTMQTLLLKKDGTLTDPVKEEMLEKGERLVSVYLPPNYSKDRKPPYNFQIVLDGGQFLHQMHMDGILNKLIDQKKIEPEVVVFISPYSGRPNKEEPGFLPVTPPGYSLGDRYQEYGCSSATDSMLAKLPEMIREQFNITDNPENTTIRGYSMGGLQAIYTALHHQNIFGNVIAQSPSAWWGPPEHGQVVDAKVDATWRAPKGEQDKQEYLKRIVSTEFDERAPGQDKELKTTRPIRFYLQAGSEETSEHSKGEYPLKESIESLAPILRSKGHYVTNGQVHIHEGGHEDTHARAGIAEGEMAINSRLRTLMDKTGTPGVSSATIDGEGRITPTVLGVTDTTKTGTKVTPETVFGAASLSKPVFTYLVLKLEQAGLLKLDEELQKILPFQKFCADKGFPFLKTQENLARLRKLDARMILSHTSGLELYKDPIDFMFEPGTQYLYSGIPLVYLQSVIEKRTGKSLEQLAHEHVFLPLEMEHTTFQPTPDPKSACSANSLFTTAEDFAKLVSAWMKDENLKKAFEPVLKMRKDGKTYDGWANPSTVSSDDQAHLATGLGWDLELNDKGDVIRAYKTGDMNEWRGQVVIDFEKNTAVVFFANSRNGHMLADQIISPQIELKYGLNYFFDKFGFMRESEFNAEIKKDCDAMTMASAPTLETLKHISSNPTYVRSGDHLYYLNKDRNICHQIEIDRDPVIQSQKLKEFDDAIKLTGAARTLSKAELQTIEKITGNSHWQHLEQSKFSEVERHLDTRHGLSGITISAEQMAQSAFGRGSNTAKSQMAHASTTAIMARVVDRKSRTAKPDVVEHSQQKPAEKSEKTEETGVKQKVEFERAEPAEKSESSHKSRTPFDSMKGGPKPAGHQ